MTLAFNPSSVSFGDVPVGNQGARAITITNSGAHAKTVTVSGDGAFRLDPSSVTVPAASADGTKGAASAVVFFQPATKTSVTAKVGAGSESCQLSGKGITGNLGDETSFTNKALFLKVPDYTVDTFEQSRAGAATESLSSFLRLGAFDFASETDRAKELLSLIHQAGPPGDPARGNHLQSSDQDAWAWNDGSDGSAPDAFTSAPPFQPRTATALATDAGNRDVFFLDDVRKRDINVVPTVPDDGIVGNGLSMAQRQIESAKLYTRGGWRDHSDGNRISTTYGDKVEVIRGNYKMIVMGRQDDPTQAMGWEASGNHIMDYASGTMPGAGYWLEWIDDYKSASIPAYGVWLLVNTTENVYQYERNAGTFRSENWGDLREEYVGSENPPPADPTNLLSPTNPAQYPPANNDSSGNPYGTSGHDVPDDARQPGINYDKPYDKKSDRLAPRWANDNAGIVRSNPHIIEKTWARRIDSWTGTEKCPVPTIREYTFADNTYGYTGSSTQRIGEANEETWAKVVIETTDVSERMESNTRAGSIFEATTAGAIFETTTAATVWEMTTAGLHTSIDVGGKLDIALAAAVDLFFGVKFEFSLAKAWELNTFDATDLKLKHEHLSVEKANVALKEYFAAVKSTKNYIDDEEAALSKVIKALNLNLGI